MTRSIVDLLAIGPRAMELAEAVADLKQLRTPSLDEATSTIEFEEASMSYEELYAAVLLGLEDLDSRWGEHLRFILQKLR